ncbi:hypothetical protein IQ249_25375 [Lusitaniella coriacea LEGE 07157]|uniref:Uncharacterized protein n=1 Tax=Lusitaniella coriacea LEGE 07157 TaxID=945747 RepID=A0A8J7JFB6_9CYAN|nr:KGK domain-containing protein [Lusitaniella coriacea]MBE9119185.1 hypothetical protein [Lusitaniella coriacea LEGE 07157]
MSSLWARVIKNWNKKDVLLFSDGVSAELLPVSGGGWQKGKLRLRLEFVPDSPPEENAELLLAEGEEPESDPAVEGGENLG